MAHISKAYSKILVILLTWLGFSCDQWGKDKYGTPSATYKAKGVVVSQTDDAPIEGIRAVLKNQPDATWGMDTVFTDSKGVFKVKGHVEFENMLYVELADVDGAINGLFNDTTVIADFSHVNFKGDDWYSGEVEKDLGIVKMEPKE